MEEDLNTASLLLLSSYGIRCLSTQRQPRPLLSYKIKYLNKVKYLTYLFAKSGVAERACWRHHSTALVRPEVRGQLLRRQLGGPRQWREGLEVRGQSRDLYLVLQLAEKLGTAQLGPAGHTARAGELDSVLIHRLNDIHRDTDED